jgi:hypothetical protein
MLLIRILVGVLFNEFEVTDDVNRTTGAFVVDAEDVEEEEEEEMNNRDDSLLLPPPLELT